MSTLPPSRKLPDTAKDLNLATILSRVLEDQTLTKRERQDRASALRTIAKALRRPMEDLPAHPGQLRDACKNFTPAMANLSARRWCNVLSLTRVTLKHAGIKEVPGRSRQPLAPEWTNLLRPLKGHKGIPLSRLARHCSSRGIKPEAVDDAVFASLLDDLTTASLSQSPRKAQRQAAVVWNRMARTVPGWPQQKITIPDYSQTYALPWSTFPPTLKQDVDAYLDRQAGTDILDDISVKALRPLSIKTMRHELGIYVSALVHRGRDPQTLCRLSDVVAIPLVKDGLRFFLERAEGNSTARAYRIAFRVKAMAQHWVKVDAAHLAALRQLCKNLDPGLAGMTDKNRGRLRQFDDPENVRKLIELPKTLEASVAKRLKDAKAPTRAEALLMQTALAIEILLMLPLRLANLTHLNLDQSFTRSRRGVVHLLVPANQTKNGEAIEAVLPAQTVRLLDLYADRYRPLLLSEPSPWLFPGVADRSKSRERLGAQITATIKRECELLVNPHLFRHIAAKLYLDAHPGAYGVIRLLHGHKSVNTTTRYYCGQETAAAVQHYDRHILNLGKQPRTGPSGSRGAQP